MDNATNANGFLSALAKHLTEKNSRASASDAAAAGVSQGSVLHTMLLLVLYSPVSIEGKGGVGHWLKQTLSTGRSGGGSAKAPERPDGPLHYESIMALVGRAHETPELVSMVQRCSDVAAAGSDDLEDVLEGGEAASSLLFDFLRQRLQANQGVATVLSTLRGILSLGPTLIPQHKALALLHMLNELLLACHAFTDEELRKALPALQGYSYWALPVGAAATSVERSLRSELAMRGASMFQLLAREIPFVLAPYARGASARRALTEALTVHVVLDDKGDWARAFRALHMAPSTPYEEEEGARRALVSMLYVLLKGAALGVSTAKLGALSYAQVLPLAAEACVLARALGEATDEAAQAHAHAHAHAGLRALAEQINAHAEAAAGRQTARASGVGDSADDVRTARLPPLTLRELDVLGGGGAGGGGAGGAQSAAAELRTAAEQIGNKRYQFDPLLAALHERLREREAGGPPRGEAPPLRVCVAGGDDVLHRLLQAYVVLRCAYPRLCPADALRLFLVPLGRHHRTAAYLAAHDGWYRRHIYAPHCAGQPTVPHLLVPSAPPGTSRRDPTAEEQMGAVMGAMHLGAGTAGGASGINTALPAKDRAATGLAEAPLRACLTEYLRSAHASVPIALFEVGLWLSPPPDALTASGSNPSALATARPAEPPFLTVAFCASLEVIPPLPTGGGAGAAEASAGAGKGDPSGGAQLAHVVYSLADPWGIAGAAPATMAARFASLSFHTHATDTGHCPSDGRLQMRCAVAGATGRSAAQPTRTPHRYVRTAAIGAGAGSAAVDPSMGAGKPAGRGAAAAAGTERFGVLVDGEYYGPFAYALVTPCVAPGDSEPLTLPLTTFFPVPPTID